MAAKFRVLSIDDNHQNLSLIQQALEERFDVISSAGEESIEELVNDCEPDIVLLDIMLSQTSGYEICKTIRAMSGIKRVVIIFISSLHALEDKIKAYQAGGNDYICKPVNIEELLCKLESYQNLLQEQQSLEAQIKEATLRAFTSMQQSNELGLLFEFFSLSHHIQNFDQLYSAAQQVTEQLKLNCTFEFRTNHHVKRYPQGKIGKLEAEILDLGKNARAVVPFGKNILFNCKHCSLLVKNITEESQDKKARLQERLAIFLDIIDSCIQSIQAQENTATEQSEIVSQLRSDIDENINQVFSQLQNTVQQQLHSLDISAADQQQLASTFTQAQAQIKQAIGSSVDVDFHHQHIEKLLGQLK